MLFNRESGIQDDALFSLAQSSNLRAAAPWLAVVVRCEGAFLCNDGINQGGCYLFGCLVLMVAYCNWVHKTHPPSLAGRASSAHSTSEQGDRPVSAGMNFWWMTSSRGMHWCTFPRNIILLKPVNCFRIHSGVCGGEIRLNAMALPHQDFDFPILPAL